MGRLVWGELPPQIEDGVDRGMIFPQSGAGVPWYGLIKVDEVLEASEVESYFVDGIKIGQSSPVEDFSAVVESFTYPEVIDEDSVFGFSYRSNYVTDGAYELHLVYNATFDVPNEDRKTLSTVVDPRNFIFVLDTAQVKARKVRPFAHLVLRSHELHPLQLQDIEERLYGTPESDPQMPTPEWIMELLDTWTFGFGHGPFGHLPFGGHTS